jgi:acyl carrier protein
MLNRESVIRDLAAELAATHPKASQVNAETRIAEDLEMDSLAVMNFIMAIEDKYDLSISVDEMAEVRTIGELADEIVRLAHGT